MVEINWTRRSVCDLESIFRFIAKDSESYANYYIEKLRNKTKILNNFPEIGRIVPELKQKKVREIIINKYRIVYKIVSANRIDILTVHHSSKEFDEE